MVHMPMLCTPVVVGRKEATSDRRPVADGCVTQPRPRPGQLTWLASRRSSGTRLSRCWPSVRRLESRVPKTADVAKSQQRRRAGLHTANAV